MRHVGERVVRSRERELLAQGLENFGNAAGCAVKTQRQEQDILVNRERERESVRENRRIRIEFRHSQRVFDVQ